MKNAKFSCFRTLFLLNFEISTTNSMKNLRSRENYDRGGERIGLFHLTPFNVLLYTLIWCITFIFQNFEILPPVRGV